MYARSGKIALPRTVKFRTSALAAAAASAVCFLTPLARAEIPTKLEPTYAEAVIAFNGKEYGRALKLLDELLKQSPAVTEALELKALTLKSKHDDAKAEKTYAKLLEEKEPDGAPNAGSAPYHFEIGLIRFRAKDHAGARQHLETSLALGFNRGACHFFLGMMDHAEKRDPDAERHFRAVDSTEAEDLKPSARFFLAQTFLREGYFPGATQSFYVTLVEGRDDLADPETSEETKAAAAKIVEAAEKSLAPFNRSKFFADLGLSLGYDSNVLSSPTASLSPGGAGSSAGKLTLSGGLGYSTSPVAAWQAIPSYRFSFVKTNHEATRDGEFITNIFSLYLTRKPLAPTTYGLKTDFLWLFQNQPDKYHQYSRTFSIGPYFRRTLRPRLALGVDLSAQFIKNLTDDAPGVADNLKKSGKGYSGKTYLQYDATAGWLNPNLTLGYDANLSDGVDFRSKGPTFGLSNASYASSRLELTTAFEYALPSYSDRTPTARSDKMMTLALSALYRFSHHLNGTLDVRTIKNSSGPAQDVADTFTYSRWMTSMGISYSL